MKKKHFYYLIYLLLFFSCGSDDDSTSDLVGLWLINSIEPEIESDPNFPDCRLLLDQIFFNDFSEMGWSYPKKNRHGNYNQICDSGLDRYLYDYKFSNGKIEAFEKQTGIKINWTIEINPQKGLVVKRNDTLYVYIKEAY